MNPPYIGDIRLCHPERDKHLRLWELTDFEIWDGSEWVHARDALKREYMVQASS